MLSSRVGSVYEGSGVAWSSQSIMCTSQSSKESTVAIATVAVALRLLSAELIDEIFSTCPVGNIKRDHEEAILVNFNHFLEEVENGLVH